jgi:hypothetical protein
MGSTLNHEMDRVGCTLCTCFVDGLLVLAGEVSACSCLVTKHIREEVQIPLVPTQGGLCLC